MSPEKRPKLTAVFKSGANVSAEVQAGETSGAASEARAGQNLNTVQLNVTVTPELRRAARVKALNEGRDLAAVVRELLQRWVDEET